MYKFVLLIFIFAITLFSKPQTNFEIISDFNNQFVIQINDFLLQKKVSQISINSNESEISSLLKNSLIQKLSSSNILLSENSSLKINLLPIYAGVEYKNYSESNDSLNRIVKYKIQGNYSDGNIVVNSPEADYIFNDTISRNDIETLENKQLDFTRGVIPNPERTFFERFVEPVAIIATAALTVFLLFSLRTN